MKRSPQQSSRDAFTLVEVVVTTFITLLGLLGIHQLLFYMMYANHVSAQTTLASSLAQDKMEQLMSSDYDRLTGGSDQSPPFSRAWTIAGGTDGFKDISIKILWTDVRNKTHEIEVKSIATDNRLGAEVGMFKNNPIGSP